ncbi:MAG: tRNA (guanosine(37)-N1)-methyltransferase TrmD [Oscillospiraceae bacterium]|nr:tRNA (guanosine(37)-N1)-methyltransferase TrmD [Oscillospiraceae bacterium]
MYTVDILTLFPGAVMAMMGESIIGRAAKKGLIDVRAHQIRDYTTNRQNQVDDYPYGGGMGCIMSAQPLCDCLENAKRERGGSVRAIYLSPCGKRFDEADARRLAREYDGIILVCGHYEGVDQRFIDECVDEEISLGDFVLTGGEIPAMAVADSVLRLVPGVLSDPECYENESHWDGLLEYPQYTRPEEWRGRSVPEVLLNGDHAQVERWRRKMQLARTKERRADMFALLPLSAEDEKLLREAERERRVSEMGPVACRPMREDDIPEAARIIEDAKAYLRAHKVDQWQSGYPDESTLREFINAGEGYVVSVGDRVAAVFRLMKTPDPNYAAITDGKWSDDLPYYTIHASAVAPFARGCGISDRLVGYAEELCRADGIRRLRADTHRRNKPMQSLLTRNGFRYRGNVLVEAREGHDPKRLAFEKRV